MPKIPTYQARGRVTTDVPSVKSNVQTPIPTIAGQLQSTIARYYVAEKKEDGSWSFAATLRPLVFTT